MYKTCEMENYPFAKILETFFIISFLCVFHYTIKAFRLPFDKYFVKNKICSVYFVFRNSQMISKIVYNLRTD